MKSLGDVMPNDKRTSYSEIEGSTSPLFRRSYTVAWTSFF